jgi:hypothetical protein
MSEPENDWAVVNGNSEMECKRCGSREPAPIGLLLAQAADVFGGFARRHNHCEAVNPPNE